MAARISSHLAYGYGPIWAFLMTSLAVAEPNRAPSAPSFPPVIPLPLEEGPIPFMDNDLADPWLRAKTADNRDTPDELYEKTTTLVESLRHTSDSAEKLDLTRQLFLDLGMLSYYLAGLETFDQKEVKAIKQDSSVTLDYIRRLFASYARELSAMTPDEAEKVRAIFHANIASQLIHDTAHFTAIELAALTKNPAAKELKPQLNLAAALDAIEQNRLAENHESVGRITASHAPEEKVLLYLYAARSFFAEPSMDAKASIVSTFLLEAAKAAKLLPIKASQKAFIYALQLWRQQKGAASSWENPPVLAPNFTDPPLMAAIKERQALFLLDQKDPQACLTLYQSIAGELTNPQMKTALDTRILDIHQWIAASDPSKLAQYFSAIDKKLAEYSTVGALGPNNSQLAKKMEKQLIQRKRNVGIETANLAANDAKVSQDVRRYVIDQLAPQIDESADKATKKRLRQKIGALHEANRNYLAALDNYKSLLELADNDLEKYHCLTAITRTQSLIAGWPPKPPWIEQPSAAKAGEAADALYQYYAKMLPVAPPTIKWRILAHMGLLLIQNNKQDAAYQLWSRNIDLKPANRHQQYAAGMMLAGDPANLKNDTALALVETIRKAGMQPIYHGAPLDMNAVYANVLYANADRAFKENNFKQAVPLLRKFIASVKEDLRLENALFMLADSFYSLNNPVLALKYVQRYASDFPDGPQAKYLLMKGVSRTKDNTLPLASSYALLYLKHFKKGPGAAMARETLVKYYLQKEWYAEASKVYQLQLEAEDLPREKQLEAALAYFELEKKYGDKDDAHWGAQQVIRLAKNNPDLLAKAFLFEANYFAAQNNLAQLANTANSLAAIDNGPPVIRRTLAYIKNLLAQRGAENQLNPAHGLAYGNPQSALHDLYAAYLQQKKGLDNKCKKTNTTACQQARRDAQKFAQTSLTQMEKIEGMANSKNAESLKQIRQALTLKIKQLKANTQGDK